MPSLKTAALIAALALTFAVAGCSKPHRITYTDGRTVTIAQKPRFDKKTGFYEYKDVTGEKVMVNKDEIEKIEEVD